MLRCSASSSLSEETDRPRGPTSCPGCLNDIPRRHTIQFSRTEPGPRPDQGTDSDGCPAIRLADGRDFSRVRRAPSGIAATVEGRALYIAPSVCQPPCVAFFCDPFCEPFDRAGEPAASFRGRVAGAFRAPPQRRGARTLHRAVSLSTLALRIFHRSLVPSSWTTFRSFENEGAGGCRENRHSHGASRRLSTPGAATS
jgi:hypothetical protein